MANSGGYSLDRIKMTEIESHKPIEPTNLNFMSGVLLISVPYVCIYVCILFRTRKCEHFCEWVMLMVEQKCMLMVMNVH